MNKLLSTLLAGAAALALSGGAFAADEASRSAGKDTQNQTSGTSVDSGSSTSGTSADNSGTSDTSGTSSTGRNDHENSRTSGAGRVNEDGRDAGHDATEDHAATDSVKEGNEDVTAQGRDPVKQEYEAAMKHCDSMSGSQHETCTTDTKKKYNQM